MNYLTKDQVLSILELAYRSNKRDHLMLLLSFQHGLRESEVVALRLSDVQDGQIHVARLKNSLETTQPLLPNKNILLDEPKALAAWLEERPQDNVFDVLFPSRNHRVMSTRQLRRIARDYMLEAQIPESLARHHSLKHAIASLMIRSGQDLSRVKQFLGHRAVSSTILYLHISDREATEAAAQVLESSLS